MLLNSDTIPFVFLLQKYYNSDFNKISKEDWVKIINVLEDEKLAKEENIAKGLQLILNANENEFKNMVYDFNRLFVGPDTLLAPPYESCYKVTDKTLMQKVTLDVRKMYLESGLQVDKKNIEPDDFLAYELEFILYLMSKDDEKYIKICEQFIDKHLMNWYEAHIKSIRENVKNSIILGLTYIFDGTMKSVYYKN